MFPALKKKKKRDLSHCSLKEMLDICKLSKG